MIDVVFVSNNSYRVHRTRNLQCPHHSLQGTDKYVLRMADDDWDPDLDFPGLDSSAVITDVGVDQFVLCHQVSAWWSHLDWLQVDPEACVIMVSFLCLSHTLILMLVSCCDSYATLL